MPVCDELGAEDATAMFVDWDAGPPPRPWEPPPRKPRLTKRDERVITWIVGINLVLLLLGPIAGATLFDAVLAFLGG